MHVAKTERESQKKNKIEQETLAQIIRQRQYELNRECLRETGKQTKTS